MILTFLVFSFFSLSTAKCPNGSTPFYTDPTMCFSFLRQKMNFIDAEGICIEKFGGHLSSVHSMFENMFIQEKGLSNFTDGADTDFWIGANAVENFGNWTWTDNTIFDFTDWDKGQPKNTSDTNCGAVNLQSGKWNSDNCEKEKPFVCLFKDRTTTTTTTTVSFTTTTASKPKTCDESWTFWNENCYKIFQNSNWLDAEDQCKVDHAHLASIHSPEEDLFVANFANYPGADVCKAPEQGWIGLYTEDNNTHWKCTDGTPTDYLNWYPGNPILPGKNNCVYMHLAPICNGKIGMFANGGSQCTGVLNRFICKKKPQ